MYGPDTVRMTKVRGKREHEEGRGEGVTSGLAGVGTLPRSSLGS